jgi:hypothetical protein
VFMDGANLIILACRLLWISHIEVFVVVGLVAGVGVSKVHYRLARHREVILLISLCR